MRVGFHNRHVDALPAEPFGDVGPHLAGSNHGDVHGLHPC